MQVHQDGATVCYSTLPAEPAMWNSYFEMSIQTSIIPIYWVPELRSWKQLKTKELFQMMIISGRQTMSSSSLSASTLDIEVVKDHLARTRKSTMLYKCRRRKSFSYTRPRPFSDKSRLYYSPPWCLPLRFEGETGEPFVGIMYVMFLSKTVPLRRLRC